MLHLSEPGSGPPRGTVETDWLVPQVREAHPHAAHAEAHEAVRLVWAVLREEAALRGVAVADVDEAAVRHRLGLVGTPDTASVGSARGEAGDPVLATALRVVRAAARVHGG